MRICVFTRIMYDMAPDQIKHTTIDLPEPLHRALKVKLAAEGRTFAEWARAHAEADTKPEPKRSRSKPTV